MPEIDLGSVVGPQGEQGVPGPAGAEGKQGPQGQTGEAGKSAYQAAKDGGYTGTEADFNAIMAIIEKHAGRHKAGGADPLTAADVGAIAHITMIDPSLVPDVDSVFALKPGSYSWVQSTKLAWQPLNTPSGDLRVVLTVDYWPGQSYMARLRYIDGSANLREYYGEDSDGGTIRWIQVATTDYALPRDGSEAMTGELHVSIDGVGVGSFLATDQGVSIRAYVESAQKKTRILALLTPDAHANDADALYMHNTVTGSTYSVLHAGNKPHGDKAFYNGNGTAREVPIGGLGFVCAVSGNNHFGIIGPDGGMLVKNDGTGIITQKKSECYFSDGKLVLAAGNTILNPSGNNIKFICQVL